jgi:hypothetical protein
MSVIQNLFRLAHKNAADKANGEKPKKDGVPKHRNPPPPPSLENQVEMDMILYGQAFIRMHPDGRKERIPPTEIMIMKRNEKKI